MSEVNGVKGQRHFSVDEEEALKRDESTNGIVKRDMKSSVDIYASDYTWPETKHHQQEIGHNKASLVGDGAVTIFEASEASGAIEAILHAVHASALAEGSVALIGAAAPLFAFGFGVHALMEAHEKGEAQGQALEKDTAHVALIGALDLPASYKALRFDGPYRHVPRGSSSPAFRATEALTKDPKGLATLQLHADRGMNAARDVLASGLSATDYLKTHPEVAKSFMKDAAFREGFQAFMYAKATLPPDQMKAFERTLDERDGWYAQSHIQFRA